MTATAEFDVCAVVSDATIAKAGFDPRSRANTTLLGTTVPACTFSRADGAGLQLVSHAAAWAPQLPSGWLGHPETVDGRQGFLMHPTTNPGCSIALHDAPEVVDLTLAEYSGNSCADVQRVAEIIAASLP
jgi:hypothetical protein